VFSAVTGRRARRAEIVRLGLGSFVDGMVGEAYSARLLGRGAETAVDPWIRKTLHAIQLDETGHAQLASDIVAWCTERTPHSMMLALRCARVVIRSKSHESPVRRIRPEYGGVSGDDAEVLWRETHSRWSS
jgi:hypothetical protein